MCSHGYKVQGTYSVVCYTTSGAYYGHGFLSNNIKHSSYMCLVRYVLCIAKVVHDESKILTVIVILL